MENITSFNGHNIRELMTEIDKAIIQVGEKYGIMLNVKSSSFEEMEAKITLQASIGDDKAKWERNAQTLGLPEDAFGKTVQMGGRTYQIVGLDLSGRMAKVLLESNGTRYQAKISDVRLALGSDGEMADKYDETSFDTHAFLAGIRGKVKFRQHFIHFGIEYEVVDVKPKAVKYPIVARNCKTGKEYVFDLLSVLRCSASKT